MMTFKRVRMLVVMALVCWSATVATVVYANVSQFTDAYSGCNWGGHSSVYFYDAYGRTASACADYTYRYTQVIDIYGVTQVQNWSNYVAQAWNEYYYGHNDCGEMYGLHSILVGWSGPSMRSTDAYR